jgi:hypothetical protein
VVYISLVFGQVQPIEQLKNYLHMSEESGNFVLFRGICAHNKFHNMQENFYNLQGAKRRRIHSETGLDEADYRYVVELNRLAQ